MADEPTTVFKFTAEGVDLEFAGSEEFVEKQVERFRALLESALGEKPAAAGAAPGGADAQPADADGPETLEAFYKARPTREGRGAIQDRILLFIFYLLCV